MGTPGPTPEITPDDVLAVFAGLDQPSTPLTSTEVAEELECTRRTAHRKLEHLAERGEIHSKKTGARSRVWWRAVGGDGSAGSAGPADRSELEEFATFVRAVEDYAIFTLDPAGNVASWNEGAERIKGYAEEEILGEHVSRFYTEEAVAGGVPEANLEAAAAEGRVEDEGWRRRSDGSQFWADVTITAVRDDDGLLRGFTKVTRDRTEQREYERRLRRERSLTEQILETVPVSISLLAPDGEFLRANSRTLERLDLDASDLGEYSANSWDMYEDGESVPPDERPWARVGETGEPVTDYECQVDLPGLGRRWLSINAAPLEVDGSDRTRVVLSAADVTEFKEQERRLERQKSELESELGEILGRVSDAFYALDEEFRFTHVNERAEELLGYAEEELLGESLWEAFPETDEDDEIREHFLSAMENQEPTSLEVYSDQLGFWVETNCYPSETGLSVYFKDVTERVRRERELEESRRLYRTTVESFPNGAVALVDEDLRYRIAGGTPMDTEAETADDLEGTTVREAISTELADVLEPRYRAALDGESSTFEAEHGGKHSRFHVFPVRDDDGEVFAAMGMSQDVTDRKERERELERYETVVETVEDGIYVVDADGQFSMVNDAYAELTGYSREELLGSDVSLVVSEETAESAQTLQRRLTSGDREQVKVVADVLTADGERIPAEATFALLPGEEAERERVGVVRDVSERRERKRALAESERRHRTLVEHFPDGAVGLFDADLRFTAIGGQLLDEVGVAEADRVGSSIHENYPEELVAEVEPYFQAALEGEVNSFEVEFHDRHLHAHTLPVGDADDGISAGMLVVQDVTDRRKMEQDLRESEAKFRMLAENLEEIVWMATPDAEEFVYLNPAFEEVWGLDRETLYEEPLSFLERVHEDDRERVREAFATLPEHDLEDEFRIVRPDGEVRWISARGTEVTDDDMTRIVGIGKEVTERVERERRLEELVDELEKSNERLEQFAYAASHDLQEPLRMVSSYLQLVERRYADELDEDGREFIEFAVDGADRMREMIDGLLEYSRVETRGDPFEPVSLDSVVEAVRTDLEVQIEESDADVAVGSLPRVEGDRSQLRQVFQNLLDNAIEYSGDEPPRVDVTAERDGDEWVIAVSDEGVGVTAEDADRIFRVFQRGPAAGNGGTGIGLALCERIVERHGGDIRVESDPGEGATFAFTLPVPGDVDA